MAEPLSLVIIEDEPLLQMLLQDFLDVLGYKSVGVAGTLAAGMELVRTVAFDAAILDLNLAGEVAWPIADALAERSFPFIIATGGAVGPIPSRHHRCRTLIKPYTLDNLDHEIAKLGQFNT